MDPERQNEYLEFLEQFSSSKQSKKFKRAFGSLNNKLINLRKKYPNNLEHDKVKEALIDLKQFHDYAYDTIYESMVYSSDMEIRLSFMLEETEKYAKILGCLGVTPMLYYSLSDVTLDFVIDNYEQIGMLTIEQLVDIDVAYTICRATFKEMPSDYNHLKRIYEYVKQHTPEKPDGTKSIVSRRVQKHRTKHYKKRRGRNR